MARLALAALVVLAAGCAAPDRYEPPAAPEPPAADAARSAAAFRSIAALAGSWEGATEVPDAGSVPKVEYRVTGGGSVVEEVLFKGMKHEMVTMYHLDGGRLLLTHYCAAGNQPTMVLAPGDDPSVLEFEFLRGTNMQPADGHMHRARFDLRDPEVIRSAWTFFKDGKGGEPTAFEYRRTK